MRADPFAVFPFVELHQGREERQRIGGKHQRVADVDARRETIVSFPGRQLLHLRPVAGHLATFVHDKTADRLAELFRIPFGGRTGGHVGRQIAGRPLQKQAQAAQLALDMAAQEAGIIGRELAQQGRQHRRMGGKVHQMGDRLLALNRVEADDDQLAVDRRIGPFRMAVAVERDLMGADPQAGRLQASVRLGDHLDDLVFQSADVRLLFGPVVQLDDRAMMRVAADEEDGVDASRLLELPANVGHALPGGGPPQVEADDGELALTAGQHHRPGQERLAHADAGFVLAGGVAPQRMTGRRRDVDFGRPSPKRLGLGPADSNKRDKTGKRRPCHFFDLHLGFGSRVPRDFLHKPAGQQRHRQRQEQPGPYHPGWMWQQTDVERSRHQHQEADAAGMYACHVPGDPRGRRSAK